MEREVQWLLREKYHNKPTKQFYKDVERLRKGEPVDYVIGFTEFLGCTIDLSKKPLIPRKETEFWVQQVLKTRASKSETFQNRRTLVLDMFAGSGCIGIAVLKNTKANVVFAEKDTKALQQIKVNLKINKVSKNRYKVIESDVFRNIGKVTFAKGFSEIRFDHILANPPYIPTVRKKKVQRSVLKYEPGIALFGGKDGLLYIRKFLASAKEFLKPRGRIYMEFDYVEKKQIEKLLRQYHYKTWKFQKDQYGKWRYVVIE